MNQRIYLIGYRGTGKTSVAKILADLLAAPCVDLDRVIETSAAQSIRQIFEVGGEPAFRDWESKCLEEVIRNHEVGVVALGGGTILRESNRDRIRATGACIWLTADVKTLASRIQSDADSAQTRPALTDLSFEQEIASVMAKREPLYRQSADHVVSTEDKLPPQIAGEILEWYRQGKIAEEKPPATD
ncbi:MAG: shikimate kinase [Planctomycetota bacterium]